VSELRLRDAVRAVVLDSDDRVLLVRFEFPNWTGWATPGGGVDSAEGLKDALRRELAEETGLEEPEIGPVVWTRTQLFDLGLGSWDGQTERYFLVRCPSFEPQPRLTWEQLNAEFVTAVRWWTLAELDESEESFAPSRLPALVRSLVDGDLPTAPLDVGV